MKTIITSFLMFLLVTSVQAQTAESVVTGASYANNVWYSLDNGTAGTATAANWDIALAATASPTAPLAAAIHFNPLRGIVCVAPVTVANFASLDTTGMTWTPLYNSDVTWAKGAFNNVSGLGQYDYGFGSYNMVNHSVEANRVFVTRSGAAGAYTCTKLYITLNSLAGTYTLTYDKLDNSDLHTETLPISTYATKNFLYYSFVTNNIIDREPAKSSWDLLFTQYVSTSELYGTAPNQTVTGVLVNQGIQVAQANDVENPATYDDYSSLTFGGNINTIGFDWKFLNYNPIGWHVVSDTVYFVKQGDGDVYKLQFTNFSGGSTGTYSFTQEKMSTVTGLFGSTAKSSLSLYPNPATAGNATLVYDFNTSSEAILKVSDLAGNVLHTENFTSAAGFNTHQFSTASLQAGLYIVSVNVNGGVLTQKLVIK